MLQKLSTRVSLNLKSTTNKKPRSLEYKENDEYIGELYVSLENQLMENLYMPKSFDDFCKNGLTIDFTGVYIEILKKDKSFMPKLKNARHTMYSIGNLLLLKNNQSFIQEFMDYMVKMNYHFPVVLKNLQLNIFDGEYFLSFIYETHKVDNLLHALQNLQDIRLTTTMHYTIELGYTTLEDSPDLSKHSFSISCHRYH
jgi:hypothetical protein